MDTLDPALEAARLSALRDLHILDTDAEQEFDDLAELARALCDAPVGLVSLVDAQRQWFKAKAGVDICETDRAHSFCAHAIRQPGLFVVPDLRADPRFADNPFVAGEPHLRFYAGVPLVTPAWHALGTLCVVDMAPRALAPAQARALEALARQAVSLLEQRRRARRAQQSALEYQRVETVLRGSRERLALALTTARMGLWDWDMAHERVTCSPEAGLLLGLRAGTLPTTCEQFLSAVHPDDRAAIEQTIRVASFVESGYGLVFRVFDQGGEERWLEATAQVQRDEAGWPTGFTGVLQDVTQRRGGEEALRRSEERLQTVIGSLPVVMFMADRDGTITLSRGRGLETLGLRDGEAVGTNVFDIYRANPQIIAQVRRTLAGEASNYLAAVGDAVFESWLSPVYDAEGGVSGVVGVNIDVTERVRVTERLGTSREMLQSIMDNIPQMIFWKDTHSVYQGCNTNFARAAGLASPEAIVGLTDHDLPWTPEQTTWFRMVDSRVMAADAPEYRIVEAIQQADGRPAWAETNKIPLHNAEGHVLGILGTFEDITERKSAEEALRAQAERLAQSEARMAEAQRVARVGSWDHDLESGVLALSAQMYRLYDLDPADGTPTPAQVLARYHPDDLAAWAALTERAKRDGLPYEMDIRIVRRDGTVRWAHLNGRGETDAAGRVTCLFGTLADVHEGRVQQEALRASEVALQRKNAALLAQQEATLDGLLILDEDRQIVSLSPRFREMWGIGGEDTHHAEDDLVLARVVEQVSDPDAFLARVRHLNAHPQETGQDEIRLKDGRTFDRTSVPVRGADGRDNGRVWYFRDITERKRGERELVEARDAALASTRTKSAFLANMSHEIRTPMNGILGMTRLLLRSALEPTARHYAATVQGSAESLLAVVNDILDVSKIEAGKMAVEVADFDLRAVIEEVVDLLGPRAQEGGVGLSYGMPPDFPQRLRGDGARLRQILTNLVGNALKFTPSGAVTVEASLLEQTPARASLRLAVRDTGVGIPAGRLGAIFESFTQADNGVSRRYGGTGLGLTICRQLVELMGGRIGVESEEGRGSEFWLTLTLDKQAQPHVVLPDTLRGLRVLVADAEVGARAALCAQLRSWGCDAVEAGTVDECLERLRGAAAGVPFGLVLLSLPMLDLAGSYLAHHLQRCAGCTGALLTLLSPGGPGQIPDDLRGLGYARSLQKPVRQSALYNAIVETLSCPAAGKPAALPAGAAGDADLAGLRVLLAEDNEINQEVAVAVLESWGCRVAVAGDGAQALRALEESPYDVVLMDVQMPGMDGLEATARIRARERGTGRRQPIVAMTAHNMAGDREQCLAAGMDDYAAKPIEEAQLRAALSQWRPGPAAAPAPEVPASQAPEPPVMDFERLGRSCAGKAALERRIMGESLRLMPLGLARLREAVAAAQAEAVRFEAHTLKGSSRTIGAEALGAVCADMEQAAKGGDLADAPFRLAQAEREWARVREALEGALGQERWRAA